MPGESVGAGMLRIERSQVTVLRDSSVALLSDQNSVISHYGKAIVASMFAGRELIRGFLSKCFGPRTVEGLSCFAGKNAKGSDGHASGHWVPKLNV